MRTYDERRQAEVLRMASALRTAPLTPQEFAEKMLGIKQEYAGDPECMHGAIDDAEEDLLRSLGYDAGINLANSVTRWYA